MKAENWRNVLENALGELPNVFRQMLPDLGLRLENAGGYFCLQIEDTPLVVTLTGKPTTEKRKKYFTLAQEKASRLFAHQGHVSSWQSRNEEVGQYGGAVRFGNFIFSFSGLPELADEALMLRLLRTCHHWQGNYDIPDDEYLLGVARISENPYYPEED